MNGFYLFFSSSGRQKNLDESGPRVLILQSPPDLSGSHMSDQTMETNVEEVEVMLTHTYRTDGEVSCTGSGSNAQEAHEAAFRHARQQVVEWKQKAAELERQLESARKSDDAGRVTPSHSADPDLDVLRVMPFDAAELSLPVHVAVLGLQCVGKTSTVARMIHSFGSRFASVDVFTYGAEGAIWKVARSSMGATIHNFSLELLESTIRRNPSLHKAVVIEDDVFSHFDSRYIDRFSIVLRIAASYNVSLFCIASGMSAIPSSFEPYIGVVAITRGQCVSENTALYQSKFKPLFGYFGDFCVVFDRATRRNGSCLISVDQRLLRFMSGSDAIPDCVESPSTPLAKLPASSSSDVPTAAATEAVAKEAPAKTDVAVSKAQADWISSMDKAIANLAWTDDSDIPRVRELATSMKVILRNARDTPPTPVHAMATIFSVLGAVFLWYAEIKTAAHD